jgi:hypothetical protein
MAVAKVMGASESNTQSTTESTGDLTSHHANLLAAIRSTSLGVSFGTGLSIENALNIFKPTDSAAWDAIDFAVFAAKS